MTQHDAGIERSRRLGDRPGQWSRALSPLLVAAAIALLVKAREVRIVEAGIQNALLSIAVPSKHVQTAVIFPVDDQLVGVSFSFGCSVGPILALFLTGCAVASWIRVLPVRAVATGALVLIAVFLVANQLRIAAIVAAMHLWGFHRGYDLSHVFLGSTITTIGFVLGVILFVKLLLRQGTTAAR